MKSTGTCYLCRETYSRQGMARHVRACRGNADLFDPDETGDVRPSDAGREYFHIVAEGRDWPAYWLHVAVPTDAPLYALDRFLRDIWLECCGHLSSFVINGVKYTSFEDDGYGPYAETRSMEARCGDILSEGTRFSYDYDFGTTTRLSLRVLGAFTFPVAVKRGIYVLARNHQPVIPCEKCGAPSRHVCGTCLWGDEGWLCDACARTHDCGPDALLPVVNSPRVGRCAYTGELMDDDDPFDAGGDGDDEVGEDEVAASSLAGMLAHADPFASERALRRVYREMTGKEFDTIEEVNVFLQALVEREDFDEPDDDPISRAQELAWQAYQADPTTGRKLAREALSIDPDCADAYVVLGNLAEDVKGAIEEYEKGVAAGERAIKRELGEDAFQTEAGHFWGIVATRPYMRARENLAVALWADGQRDEAIRHLQDMLRLNPDDNQGVRYSLVNRLLELGRTAEAGRLLARYSEDSSCEWLYSKALWHYQQSGDSSSSRRALESAIDANPYVALMLDEIAHEVMEGKSSDDIRPDTPYYSPGSPEEAMLYAFDAFGAWVESGDAILWLMETVQRFAGEIGGPRRVEKIGRNDPCPCGSGKKYKKCCGR